MFIEAYINGQLKNGWYYDDVVIPGSLEQVMFTEKVRQWNEMLTECKVSLGSAVYESEQFEMYINIRARVQPDDITNEELDEFNRMIADIRVDRVVKRNKPRMNGTSLE